MKKIYLLCCLALAMISLKGQTVLINYNFQSALPAGVTANYNGGSLSFTKTADGVCSLGAATVNAGGNLQVSVASCSVFRVNMKSSGSSARTVTVKYKLQTDTGFTTLSTSLSVQTAAIFDFHTLYPNIIGSAPITVSIEPTSGNIQIHDLYVESNNTPNTAAEITAFSLPNQTGNTVINAANANITLNMPLGTNLTSIVPANLAISSGATINPTATTARNFSTPITYTVTAQNGTTTKVWTVTVATVAATEKDITAFQLAPTQIGNATINTTAGTVSVSMPQGSVLTNIVPQTLSISANATINPTPSVARNFSTPVTYTVTAQNGTTKNWTISVNLIEPRYNLTVRKTGVGSVSVNPEPTNGTYAAGTVVTLTATAQGGNNFINWTGDASGNNATTSVTMGANKTVTANFTSNFTFNFNRPVGYASISGDGFAGPTIGAECPNAVLLTINSPAEFNTLCEKLYYRSRAFRGNTTVNGVTTAPMIVLLKAGVYDGSQTLSTDGAKAFGNDMLDIAEQGNMTFIGERNVVFKFGINVKRSFNLIIRNISFYDYNDDAINVGYPETHHIWIDHCTFGHPTTLPANSEVPDGTSEVKDGASYITISWCKYQNHWKTCLLGHSDNNGSTDIGRLKTTYFANYFSSTNSRHPRTRFGTVHVLNNLYENVGLGRTGHLGYGIGASNSSQVWAEGNFFLDTRWPMLADRSEAAFAAVYGSNLLSPNSNIQCYGLKSVNNEYDDSGLTQTLVGTVAPAMLNPSGKSIKFDSLITANFTYNPANDYTYAPMSATSVRTLIPIYAGADQLEWSNTCGTVGLYNLEIPKATLKVTPSVSSDILTLEMQSSSAANIFIVNMLGQVLETYNIEASENNIQRTIHIEHLPNGIYTVVLSNKYGNTTAKFVKQ